MRKEPRGRDSEVCLFRPATPEIYLGIATYYDWTGDDGIRVARILAHSPQAAVARLADEIYAEYGTSRAAIEAQIDRDGFADEVPVVIRELEIYTDVQLQELDLLATAAARAATAPR